MSLLQIAEALLIYVNLLRAYEVEEEVVKELEDFIEIILDSKLFLCVRYFLIFWLSFFVIF